jgi:hypothetical protein
MSDKQGGSIGAVTYEAKNKRQNLLRNLHRRKKKNIIFYLRCDCEAKKKELC